MYSTIYVSNMVLQRSKSTSTLSSGIKIRITQTLYSIEFYLAPAAFNISSWLLISSLVSLFWDVTEE